MPLQRSSQQPTDNSSKNRGVKGCLRSDWIKLSCVRWDKFSTVHLLPSRKNLATLFFTASAISESLLFLFLTAFVISLMTLSIYLVVMHIINQGELQRVDVLQDFLKAMPTPQ